MTTKQKAGTTRQAVTVLVGILFIVLVFGAGMFYGGGGTGMAVPTDTDTPDTREVRTGALPNILYVRPTDVPKGESDILLIEYSDFECPFCERFHPTVQTLVDSGEVQWIYRHLPLPFHETADEGALIAECVRIHKGGDSFWEFVDGVFTLPEKSLATYRSLAQKIGLQDAQIDACLEEGGEARDVLNQHLNDAQAFGIDGTPGSFLVNTKTEQFRRVPGALPLEGNDGVSLRGILQELQ